MSFRDHCSQKTILSPLLFALLQTELHQETLDMNNIKADIRTAAQLH